MRYDFDHAIGRRNTDCAKWDEAKFIFGQADVIPMWVADMDFAVAGPITEALQRRSEHAIYGYPRSNPPSVIEAIITRLQAKYDWKIRPEWIVLTPGVIPALYAALKAYTQPGDEVIVQSPVYYPFWSAIRDSGCQAANNPLQLVDGRYEMDFDDLAKQFGPRPGIPPAASRARIMILCNPHNPVGRVWTRQELIQLGDIIIKNGAVMISDEIHCELLFEHARHVPFATLSKQFEQNCLVCMSPSKTFNLAGLAASAIIIPNEKLRTRFKNAKTGIMPFVNVFGLTAMESAYRYGDEWLAQLLEYLHGNLHFLMQYFREKIPQIKVIKPEGTYLVWLDCRSLGLAPSALSRFMTEKAGVGLDDGYVFGPNGAGFERMNIACPRATLARALGRIEKAVRDLPRTGTA